MSDDHRYNKLNTLIDCIQSPQNSHRQLKELMKKELNRQFNCCLKFQSGCNCDCGPCLYYGDDWSIMLSLIKRVLTIGPHKGNKGVVEAMTALLNDPAFMPCNHLYKTGACNLNCTSCGL